MMASKIDAFLERQEIRDAYDLEFLVKKGVIPEAPAEKLRQVTTFVKSLPPQDYKVKLSSLLEEDLRQYYQKENFKILLRVLDSVMAK